MNKSQYPKFISIQSRNNRIAIIKQLSKDEFCYIGKKIMWKNSLWGGHLKNLVVGTKETVFRFAKNWIEKAEF
jgi:hypothetical protein